MSIKFMTMLCDRGSTSPNNQTSTVTEEYKDNTTTNSLIIYSNYSNLYKAILFFEYTIE